VPEGAHRDAGDHCFTGLGECAVYGADYKLEKLVTVFHRAAFRRVLELVVEPDLGALYAVASVVVH
jgi:hypothetical protein